MKLFKMFEKVLGLVLVLALVILISPVNIVSAAALTAKSDTMSSLKVSTLANHDMLFTSPTGVASGQTIIITFPSDFSIAAALDFTDIDVLDDGSNVTLAASPTGATWGAVRTSATVITLTNGTTAVGAGSIIRVRIGTNATNQSTGVRQITNTTTNGSKSIAISGTFTDTGNITVTILSDDQVAVTATVDQSISFSISDNTIEFGTLTSADDFFADDSGGNATETEAHTLIVGTNAASGYTMTLSGSTLTCSSCGGATITAIGSSNTASSTGSEQFGVRFNASGGSGVVSAPYAAAGFAFDTASFPDEVAAYTAPSANTTYSARYIANIAAITEAGAYTTALTYTAVANF